MSETTFRGTNQIDIFSRSRRAKGKASRGVVYVFLVFMSRCWTRSVKELFAQIRSYITQRLRFGELSSGTSCADLTAASCLECAGRCFKKVAHILLPRYIANDALGLRLGWWYGRSWASKPSPDSLRNILLEARISGLQRSTPWMCERSTTRRLGQGRVALAMQNCCVKTCKMSSRLGFLAEESFFGLSFSSRLTSLHLVKHALPHSCLHEHSLALTFAPSSNHVEKLFLLRFLQRILFRDPGGGQRGLPPRASSYTFLRIQVAAGHRLLDERSVTCSLLKV